MIESYFQKDDITIYCGDCLEIMPQLEPVDLVLTDPPYDIHAGRGGGCFGNRDHLIKTGGFTDGGVDYSFLYGIASWFCFCSIKQLSSLLMLATECDHMNLLTWNKTNPVPTCNNKYLPDVEYIVHGFANGRLFGKFVDKSTFHLYSCGNKETEHPNEKPKTVISRLLRLGSEEGDIILDPFLGSGTTLVAAKELGRKAIGIEIEEEGCEISANRVEKAIKRDRMSLHLESKEERKGFEL